MNKILGVEKITTSYWFGILLPLSLLLATNSWSQQQLYQQDGKYLAAQEAERFARTQLAAKPATPNQTHFDVHSYDIQLEVLPTQQLLIGNVGITIEVIGQPIEQLEVDLASDMVVDSVQFAGQAVLFTHANDLITIALGSSFSIGEQLNVIIFYHGTPSFSGFGAFSFNQYNDRPMIWSLSEPFGARNWWPCKDLPEDKADSVTFRVTVQENLMAVSNGRLRSVTTTDGKKAYTWHEQYPIATYLVAVTIHPFLTFSDSLEVVPGRKMPIDFFVFPENLEFCQNRYARTITMIQTFSELFGIYPFHKEKYGHVQFLGGANMEHQTLTSLRENASESTIAHELAHQWWGDLITCRDFSHIWLNEGFATYAEALWAEANGGPYALWEKMDYNRYLGAGTIFVSQMDVGTIFNYNLSYRKAAWVLHMLRHVVGDANFFTLLRHYRSDPRFQYKTVTTEEFKQFCEEQTGKDLDDFFQQWIYEQYLPHYVLSYRIEENVHTIDTYVTIRQEQENTVLFHMPIDLHIDFSNSDTTIVVDNRLAIENYHFNFNRSPVAITLDPNWWILKVIRTENYADTIDSTVPPETFQLMSSHPNPFRNQTHIDLQGLLPGQVTVAIYNLLGQRLKVLYQGESSLADLHLSWHGEDQNGNWVAPGTYFCRVTQPGFTHSIKLVKLN